MEVYFYSMVSIVKLTNADAAILSNIGGKSLIESHGHSAPPEVMQEYVANSFSLQACREELEDEKNIFYALYYNDEPAGYYKIILDKPHPAVSMPSVTYMERLYLLNSFYDLKLGQQLMQHALHLSKAAGEKGMWLTVWKKNERALRFYQKHRFGVAGEGTFRLTGTHVNPTWVMLLTY
jgi:ribosomal protein S18 acetylase RimI-like enzyme